MRANRVWLGLLFSPTLGLIAVVEAVAQDSITYTSNPDPQGDCVA